MEQRKREQVMQIEAHYTNLNAAEKRANPGHAGKLTYSRTTNGNREWFVMTEYVIGKSDARKAAKAHNAIPWNF